MKQSGFKKKNYPWNRVSKKGLFDEYIPEKKNLFVKKESRLQEWRRIKDEIRPYFEINGLIDVCELAIPEVCIGNSLPLEFAHSKKRGDIAKQEPERSRELKEVVRACTECHKKIEYIPKEKGGKQKMYEIVTKIIEERNRRLG